MTVKTQSTSTNNKISTYLTLIVLIVMALAVTALLIAGETYLAGDQVAAGVLAGIGLLALAMSVGLLFQSKRQSAEVKVEAPKVMTIIECNNKSCKKDSSNTTGKYSFNIAHA